MIKIKITAPNRGFNGTRNGVLFSHGKAEVPVDHEGLGYFVKRGYIVEIPESGIYNDDDDVIQPTDESADDIKDMEPDIPFDEPEKDLEEYTVAQLKAMAEDREINLGRARRKADIIEILVESH